MEQRYSAYKEFNSRREAEEVVRVLVASGFPSVQTENLYEMQTIVDVGTPPWRRSLFFQLAGLFGGACAGVVLGILLFYVPKTALGFPSSMLIVLAGVITCAVASAVVGLMEGFILAKRETSEPISGTRRGVVGVRVTTDSTADLKRAKIVLARYGETPDRKVSERLFRLRSTH